MGQSAPAGKPSFKEQMRAAREEAIMQNVNRQHSDEAIAELVLSTCF